jgi:hypothetical protein
MVAVTPVRLTSRTGVFLRMGLSAYGRNGVWACWGSDHISPMSLTSPICPQLGRDELLLIRRSGSTSGFAETPIRPYAHTHTPYA